MAAVVFVLASAYQDVVAVHRLRQELAGIAQVRVQNQLLRDKLSITEHQNAQALTEVDAMAHDIRHLAGVLGLPLHAQGMGIGNLLSQLQTIHKELPDVLSAAQTREDFLLHKPDMLPVQGPVVSGFGWRTSPFGGEGTEFHDGVDLDVPIGTPVHATAAGVVTYAGWYGGYGNYVQIDHGYGITSFYGHNSRILVHVGEDVTRGQVIALSGDTGYSTGPHVHFGIHYRGLPTNPLNFIRSNPVGVN